MNSRQPETNLARAIPSSAGDRLRGGRSIRSEVYSLIPLLRALALVRAWNQTAVELLQLPDTLREALFLKAGAGYEYEEIAKLVATDVGTVKCRAQKAMRRLVELLEVHNDSVVPIHPYLPHGNASESNAELLHHDRVCTNNLNNLIEYALEKNISRYKLLLLETTDEKRRTILQGLLSEEEAKMDSNGKSSSRSPSFDP
jgi:hypothetical protein